MHENHLIQRAKLGRCLERGYTLPPGAVFGHKNVTCDGGTAAALKFSPLNARIKSASPESLEKDFVRLNRAALKAGVISPAGQKQFRALNDFRLTPPSRDVKTNRITIPENMTFGKPVWKNLRAGILLINYNQSRPKSPIYEVIEHKFQKNWLIERKLQDQRLAQVK